jgi:putative membrane protein
MASFILNEAKFLNLTLLFGGVRVPMILNYLLHLATAVALVAVYFILYTRMTPYDEVMLIRQGNHAAALSLGGTLIGFSLTIASAMLHTRDHYEFLVWSCGAMLAQVLVFQATTRLLHMSKDQIEANNAAFGGLLGALSISIGLVNAGAIS